MKESITKYCLYMAFEAILISSNLMMVGVSVLQKDWQNVIFFLVFTLFFVVSIVISYKRAKRKEKQMQSDIQTLMNLQAFDLLRRAFENHPDSNPNGFGAKPINKDDEVERNNGTPV